MIRFSFDINTFMIRCLVSYLRHPFLEDGDTLPLCRGYSQHILSPTIRADVYLIKIVTKMEHMMKFCVKPQNYVRDTFKKFTQGHGDQVPSKTKGSFG